MNPAKNRLELTLIDIATNIAYINRKLDIITEKSA